MSNLEPLLNISKKTLWLSNTYDVYNLSKGGRGKWLNTWFKGLHRTNKNNSIIYTDQYWTLKETDRETSSRLYHQQYNPVLLSIMCPVGAKFLKNDEGKLLYNMLAQISSIDDSSFSIRFNNIALQELESIRLNIMQYVSSYFKLNGEDFLRHCTNLGGTDIDYD